MMLHLLQMNFERCNIFIYKGYAQVLQCYRCYTFSIVEIKVIIILYGGESRKKSVTSETVENRRQFTLYIRENKVQQSVTFCNIFGGLG